MLPELRNIQISFPFAVSALDVSSSTEADFMRSVKELQIWVRSSAVLQAYVTSFSSEGFFISFTQNGAPSGISLFAAVPQLGETVGKVTQDSGEGRLVEENSFVKFSNPIVGSGTCNIPLLPQVIKQIPEGLRLRICGHNVQAVAQDQNIPGEPVWEGKKINFLSGFNFEPSTSEASITLTAGAGLGKGAPSAYAFRKLLQGESAQPDSYYTGVRVINGSSGDISIKASGALYLHTSTENGTTDLSIRRRGASV